MEIYVNVFISFMVHGIVCHLKTLHEGTSILKALKSYFHHNCSDDLDPVACLLGLHDIKDSPIKMKNPLVDFLVCDAASSICITVSRNMHT